MIDEEGAMRLWITLVQSSVPRLRHGIYLGALVCPRCTLDTRSGRGGEPSQHCCKRIICKLDEAGVVAWMGLGSDIVSRLHAPLAAAAAVVGAAAASSADLRPEKLQSRAFTPIIPYSAHDFSGPSVFLSGSAVAEVHMQRVHSTTSSAVFGLSSSSSCVFSSPRVYGPPAICFYGGANRSAPVCFSDASRFEPRAGVASSPFMPPCLSQYYGPRASSFLHRVSDPRVQVEGAGALAFHVNLSSSVLYPGSLFATSLLGSHSLGHVSASTHLKSLLLSLVDRHQSAGAVPSSFTRAALHTWKSSSAGPLDLDSVPDAGPHDKDKLTVVLLGWLGSHQKQLRKYAEWYTNRGINAVTFVIPFKDILLYRPGGKAEEHVDKLAEHLVSWMNDKADGENDTGSERQLLFHTFSNTGWLTYGFILEKLLKLDERQLRKIKGCVVDSAPAAKPDPRVWANGFSAALLAKRSAAVRKGEFKDGTAKDDSISIPEPHVAEAALLALLEKFFKYFFMIPPIRDRLSEVTSILTKRQPPCPQLYIYSTADRVIPHTMVESFAEQQRQDGHVVRAYNMQLSPHVDHFRTFPDIYGKQLQSFLQDCINRNCKQ